MIVTANTGHLLRLRMELDRTMRTRAVIGRAVRGGLTPPEYADLLQQLSALLVAVGGDDLVRECERDIQELGVRPRPPCHSATLLGLAIADRRAHPMALDAVLAAAGTSWVSEAAGRLRTHKGYSTRFLDQLEQQGQGAAARLKQSPERKADQLLSLCEMARGSLLGAVAWLDHVWKAPMTYMQLGA